MGYALDLIQRKVLIDGPVTVDSNYNSEIVSLDGTEENFSVDFIYDNGSSVDMVISLEVSVDGENFVMMGETNQAISDNEGTHIWDIGGSGTQFLRVHIEVNSGAIDVQRSVFVGKKRH